MDPIKVKKFDEAAAQRRVVKALTLRGWFTMRITGNRFISGLPDLISFHPKYGVRFIEMKRTTGFKLRASQFETFSAFEAEKVGTWILVDSTPEELNKLFRPANWRQFVKKLPQEASRPPDRQADGPERRLTDEISETLRRLGWFVVVTWGGAYQGNGLPDLLLARQGAFRLADVKLERGSKLTPAQRTTWPKLEEHGCPVHILRSIDDAHGLLS